MKNPENSENPDKKQTQSLLSIDYDVSDPKHPEAVRIRNKTRTKNAEYQAKFRQSKKEKGEVPAQLFVPQDKKSELESIAKKLADGEDVNRTKEFDALNKTLTDLNEQIKKLSSQLEKSQKELEASRVEAKESNQKIEKVPKLVKWFCGI
tara:strand:- start:30 stop:479 length:450 start_codon:yes stop_codon:yes gene_type:complete